jgi:hypothetical protein
MRSVNRLLFVVAVLALPLAAQWLDYPTAGVPRTPDGKPDLSAPAPKASDGKPDLSGVWRGLGKAFKFTLEDLANNFQTGEFPMQPWAQALVGQRRTNFGIGDREAECLTEGIPRIYGNSAAFPMKIVQTPGMIAFLYEHMWTFRQVFLDGRKLPSNPNPTWLGYSVGHWDEDTLVIDSAGFNGKTWLDDVGHPTTEALHITERLHRIDFGHMELKLTVDDPNAYTKPWTITEALQLYLDGELIEYQCLENEKDLIHIRTEKQ